MDLAAKTEEQRLKQLSFSLSGAALSRWGFLSLLLLLHPKGMVQDGSTHVLMF